MPGSLDSWIGVYREWVDKGACELIPDGIDPFLKTIPRESFKLCLKEWILYDPIGVAYKRLFRQDETTEEVNQWRQAMQTIDIDNPHIQAP